MTTTRTTEGVTQKKLGERDLAKLNNELSGATWETHWLEADEGDEADRKPSRTPHGHA